MTAEFAVALPAIALVLAACLASVRLASDQVQLTDAAADAARALGRDESAAEAEAIAERLAPGAVLVTGDDGEFRCVELSRDGRGFLSAIRLTANSCALGGGR